MSSFYKPTADERELLTKAVSKFTHDPVKSQLSAKLALQDGEYAAGTEDWNHLKYCVEKHHLHLQTEIRRDPKKKALKEALDKADALARKFQPNFS